MMMATVNVKKSSPLHEILQWSTSRPEWQRDGLRQIILKSRLAQGERSSATHPHRSAQSQSCTHRQPTDPDILRLPEWREDA